MYCIKKVKENLLWVGADDRRLAMFEGVYSVPKGVSYNSYLLLGEKTVLFDTVDKAVRRRFLENVADGLGGRNLDYLVIQHMEPDHSAALTDILEKYSGVKLVCSARALEFINQFLNIEPDAVTVADGDEITAGEHTLRFFTAPMVHWPEVIVTYDVTDGVLFSADAFGCFGALNGALFSDEVDFEKDYSDEFRRYYANIVGKYGVQTQSLLGKVSALKINMICPLHGFVFRHKLQLPVSKYTLWGAYQPEEKGVAIAYASVYGNTENAAEILACRLRGLGVKTVMFDVSVTPASEIIAAAFRWSHLVFASVTYNAGIFVSMEDVLNDLTAHNIQNRIAAVIENGSWAPASGSLIRQKLKSCKNITLIEPGVTIKSSLKPSQLADLYALADAIAKSIEPTANEAALPGQKTVSGSVERAAMFKLSYGLFVLSVNENGRDNACIINTAVQITESPPRISVAVNKSNYTHEIMRRAGEFNISVLTQNAPFGIFQRFGFRSGRDTDKFEGFPEECRTPNGIRYVSACANGVISAKITESHDYGTHTVFAADVTEAFELSSEPSVTYQYYFDNIKPKPDAAITKKHGFVCRICGYVHEGDSLPEDFICPLCKHGAADFERV